MNHLDNPLANNKLVIKNILFATCNAFNSKKIFYIIKHKNNTFVAFT